MLMEAIMSSAAVQSHLTPEEYLALERKATTKSEYLNGQTYAMAGASREHNLIAGNVFGELRFQLRERACEAYINDMRVKISPTGLYTYPDVVVVCEEPRFEDSNIDTLLNPNVLVEVLSPSTEAYDRGEKSAHYRQLESLQEYILVAQDRVHIEHYLRQGTRWLLTEFSDLDDVFHLVSIGCELSLLEIYAKVEFPAGEAGQEA
jgi:Uma2 family endonuclease